MVRAGTGVAVPSGRGKRVLLGGVAVSLCLTAAIAIGTLLIGEFGSTQARILTSTLLAGGYGLLAVPAAVLIDQGRRRPVAIANATLAGAGLALMLALIWSDDDPPRALVKLAITVTVGATAAGQIAATMGSGRPGDPPSVRRARVGSSALAIILTVSVGTMVWGEFESVWLFRALGALAVSDVLLVALQPVLAKMHAGEARTHRIRLTVESGGVVDISHAATDFSTAVARAITAVEHEGGRVVRVDRLEAAEGNAPDPARRTTIPGNPVA